MNREEIRNLMLHERYERSYSVLLSDSETIVVDTKYTEKLLHSKMLGEIRALLCLLKYYQKGGRVSFSVAEIELAVVETP